jgi:HAD superfamily hydrolase (TIGR01509 family)
MISTAPASPRHGAPSFPASEPELVILDCDGVLVDSEEVYLRAINAELAELGGCGPLTIDDVRGLPLSQIITTVERRSDCRLPADFPRRFEARVGEEARHGVPPIPGVVDAVRRIDRPMCVASNSPWERVHAFVAAIGLGDQLGHTIHSGHRLGVFKPDPRLFAMIADSFGASTGGCVVVEDSVAGVQGAVDAGMCVLGYDPAGAGSLGALGAVSFSDMACLPQLVSLVGRRARSSGSAL